MLQYGGQDAGFCFAFDEPLSHLIYAACDIILVPSMFEPCGLTQVTSDATGALCTPNIPVSPALQTDLPYISCLLQMIAMRYGAIPVVRQTGGLRDTIFDVDNDKPRAAWEMEGSTNWQVDGVDETNGFSFEVRSHAGRLPRGTPALLSYVFFASVFRTCIPFCILFAPLSPKTTSLRCRGLTVTRWTML
jgi:hypothetical protein